MDSYFHKKTPRGSHANMLIFSIGFSLRTGTGDLWLVVFVCWKGDIRKNPAEDWLLIFGKLFTAYNARFQTESVSSDFKCARV